MDLFTIRIFYLRFFISSSDIKFGPVIIFNIQRVLFERSIEIVNSYIKLNKYFLFFIFNIFYFFFSNPRKMARFILINTLTKELSAFISIIIVYF